MMKKSKVDEKSDLMMQDDEMVKHCDEMVKNHTLTGGGKGENREENCQICVF